MKKSLRLQQIGPNLDNLLCQYLSNFCLQNIKTNELADNYFKTFTKNLTNMPIRNDHLDLSLTTNLQSYGGDLEEEAKNLI